MTDASKIELYQTKKITGVSITNQILVSGTLSGVLCLIYVTLLLRVAVPLGLIDSPDARKHHVGDIPAVGGLAVYLSVFSGVILVGSNSTVYMPLLIGSILVLTGLLDDRFGLSARLRLPIQAFAAVLMIHVADLGIESIGSIWGSQEIVFTGIAVTFFTIMCTVGVINSINMIDGIDGLSGSVMLLTFAPLIYFSQLAGEVELVVLLSNFMCAILAFLYFNARIFRPSAKVFMGDTGSMLLGFVLVWVLISLTQGADAVLSPVAAGWVFGLPLVDTVSVMVRRLLEKRSPFGADRSHIHYKLLDAGLSVNQTVLVMVSVHLTFIIIGVLANAISLYEPVLFWSFISLVLLHHFFTDRVIKALFGRLRSVGSNI